MCDPNLFYGFSKKKNVFEVNHKLRDELPSVIKVTLKTLRKGEGGQKTSKNTKKICTDKTCMEVNLAPSEIKKILT